MLGDFTVKQTNKLGKGNMYLTKNPFSGQNDFRFEISSSGY